MTLLKKKKIRNTQIKNNMEEQMNGVPLPPPSLDNNNEEQNTEQ